MFDWAKFRLAKGVVKLPLILDNDAYLPNFAHITDGEQHEVKVLNIELIPDVSFPKDSIIVFDRACVDTELFSYWTTDGVFFVTRIKDNTDYRVTKRCPLPDRRNVLKDQEIGLEGFSSNDKCPHLLRRIKDVDRATGKNHVFVTNHMNFATSTVASIYKFLWEIEDFFKTIKQHLKIKSLVGTSPDTVKVQIWTALIAILLLKYQKMTSQYLGWLLSNLIAFSQFNLFIYRDINDW
jgi:IS4 transposase